MPLNITPLFSVEGETFLVEIQLRLILAETPGKVKGLQGFYRRGRAPGTAGPHRIDRAMPNRRPQWRCEGVNIIEQLANPGNYGGSREAGQIKYLVIHYTGNDGDKAANNAAYFQKNVVKASAHYFVDDTAVYRSVPELTVAWAVGGKKYPNADKTGGGTMYGVITNTNSLSVELCDTRKDGTYQATEATLGRAVELCRELMARYGIPLDRVYRHFDVTGKHCPSYFVNDQKWAEFKRRLEGPETDNTPGSAYEEAVEWAVEQGILRGTAGGDLMLSQPVTREQLCTMLYRYNARKE